jgi:hypothetical protein
MTIETIADVDTRIVNARWRLLHGTWADNVDEVELARVAIDVLLERRYQITQASAPVA